MEINRTRSFIYNEWVSECLAVSDGCECYNHYDSDGGGLTGECSSLTQMTPLGKISTCFRCQLLRWTFTNLSSATVNYNLCHHSVTYSCTLGCLFLFPIPSIHFLSISFHSILVRECYSFIKDTTRYRLM